jgi:hypothetical protein
MSGYMMAIGPCICCGSIFSFNPDRVPSTRAITGEREPVCRGCMDRINARREADGLVAFPIMPDAYEAAEQ